MENDFCKFCLEYKCICFPPGTYCVICDDISERCVGHSVKKPINPQKTENEHIEEIVKYVLSNEKIVDKVIDRLVEIRGKRMKTNS